MLEIYIKVAMTLLFLSTILAMAGTIIDSAQDYKENWSYKMITASVVMASTSVGMFLLLGIVSLWWH